MDNNSISDKRLPHLICDICGKEKWRSVGGEKHPCIGMACEYCGNYKVVNLLDSLTEEVCKQE